MNGTADAEGITTTARDYWGTWGIDTTLMKPEVKPGDDFYAHVNGKWLDTFEIPADRTRYGAFTLLAEKSEQRVRKIIDELAATKPDPKTGAGKVAAFYNAYLDVDAIDAAGLAPAQPYLDKIKAVKTREDLAALFGSPGFRSPVAGFVDIDSKQTDTYIFQVTQAGLGLPDRDYYLVDSEANLKIRTAYMEYLTFLMGKAGYADPAATAKTVYDLEKAIATEHWDRAVGRNRNLTYNKVSKAEMVALGGGFPVETFMKAIGVDGQQDFVVRQLTPTAEELATEKMTPEQAAKLGSGIPGSVQARQHRADRSVAGVACSRLPQRRGQRAAVGHRCCQLRVLRHGSGRPAEAARTLAARRGCGRRIDGRDRRQDLCGPLFPCGKQGRDGRAGQQPAQGDGAEPHRHRLDGRGHQGRGARQAGQVHPQDRLYRKVRDL